MTYAVLHGHRRFLPCDAQILGPLSRSEGLELVNARISNSRVLSMRGRAEMDSPVKTSFVEDRDCFAKKYPLFHMLKGEVIGCGVDFSNHVIFFTKNGMLIGEYRLFCSIISASSRADRSSKLVSRRYRKSGKANACSQNSYGPNSQVDISKFWPVPFLLESTGPKRTR